MKKPSIVTVSLGIACLAVFATLAPAALAQDGRWGYGERPQAGTPEGVGTVQYEPGTPADAFLVGGAATAVSYLNGNRFDTRNGQPLSVGTITGVTWYQGADPSSFAGVVIGPIGGAPAFAVAYNPSPYTFNAAAPSVPVTPPFFAGLALNPAQNFGSIGARSATYNGGGFHGHQQSFSGGATTALTNLNVMVRVTGSVVIPVELLEFEIE